MLCRMLKVQFVNVLQVYLSVLMSSKTIKCDTDRDLTTLCICQGHLDGLVSELFTLQLLKKIAFVFFQLYSRTILSNPCNINSHYDDHLFQTDLFFLYIAT